MHALSTEYNILYNGELAYQDAKKQLAASFRDNYWEILPIERIEIEEVLMDDRPGAKQTGSFNRAEEKATKAIQKHSMYFNGREHNPQIDEAYLLLGKARYYDGRFIPALDAFNFILDRYPNSNSVNQAKVWKAKVNIRLKNEELAAENLKKMLKQENLENEDWVDGAAMLAQAYVTMDSLPQALHYIKQASEQVKDKELKGRYLFIKGQIYNALKETDSANMAFDEVIALKRKTSRTYYITSFMEKAENFDFENGNHEAQQALLQDLAQDRENRPFLDRIYYQQAEFHRKNDSLDHAIANYNLSIQNFKQDKILQSKNYQTLAELNFDAAHYKTAGAYYDSTLTFMEEKTRGWRRIKKKRENLDDVIKYEDLAVKNDSILKLVAMSDTEKMAYFTEYTSRLKAKAVADSIAQAKRDKGIADNEFYKKGANREKESGGTFYFYNQTAVSYGKQEFRKIWGDRSLQDNWRISTKSSNLPDEVEEEDAEDTLPIAEDERFNPESYIARIPTDQNVIDSLGIDRNFAYYQLGLIYKEKFREYPLAIDRLETLMTNAPEERLVIPTLYNLYKLYELQGDNTKAEAYKNRILNEHPDSRYAQILRNPDSQLPTDESSPEFKYKTLYAQFENQEYEEVIAKADDYITLYDGTEIVPKFEMLKATALGRQDGFEAYKTALNFVSLTYPNSEEGKQAQHLFTTVLPTMASSEFIAEKPGQKWKLVYVFPKEDTKEAEALKEVLDKAIKDLKYADMSTSIDYYNPKSRFVIVHGLRSRLGTEGLGEVLKEKKEYKVKREFFEISSPNYRILQIHKNLEAYLNPQVPTEPAPEGPAQKKETKTPAAPKTQPEKIQILNQEDTPDFKEKQKILNEKKDKKADSKRPTLN